LRFAGGNRAVKASPNISCIICAFNEEKLIGALLSMLSTHPIVGEIIVVDDGSTDGTAQIARRYGAVRLIVHATNRGKSAAVASGMEAAGYDFVMLLDADLSGLSQQNVEQLALPVLLGTADVTVSLRRNSLYFYRLIGLDFVSGERVFPRAVVAGKVDEIAHLPAFGFEAYFNRLIGERQLRIQIVRWENVLNSRKAAKIGLWMGTKAEFGMVADICWVTPPWEIVAQNYQLLSLTKAGKKRALQERQLADVQSALQKHRGA
jgi:glycosyltransferase involved in cell wall biosynthesis